MATSNHGIIREYIRKLLGLGKYKENSKAKNLQRKLEKLSSENQELKDELEDIENKESQTRSEEQQAEESGNITKRVLQRFTKENEVEIKELADEFKNIENVQGQMQGIIEAINGMEEQVRAEEQDEEQKLEQIFREEKNILQDLRRVTQGSRQRNPIEVVENDIPEALKALNQLQSALNEEEDINEKIVTLVNLIEEADRDLEEVRKIIMESEKAEKILEEDINEEEKMSAQIKDEEDLKELEMDEDTIQKLKQEISEVEERHQQLSDEISEEKNKLENAREIRSQEAEEIYEILQELDQEDQLLKGLESEYTTATGRDKDVQIDKLRKQIEETERLGQGVIQNIRNN